MNIVQKRNLILFNSGRIVSLIGSGVQMIAIPLYILDLTGSGALMGLCMVLAMVPALVMAPISGVLGDRFNRKLIAIYTDYGRGLLILSLAGLAVLGRMNVNILFISQIVISIVLRMSMNPGNWRQTNRFRPLNKYELFVASALSNIRQRNIYNEFKKKVVSHEV